MHLFDLFLCMFSNVFSNRLPERRHLCTSCIYLACLHHIVHMYFQMSVQSACIRGYKVALDASFVRLFCNGCFLMCSQTVSPRVCILRLVALVYHMFSNVPSNDLREGMQSHICCTFLLFFTVGFHLWIVRYSSYSGPFHKNANWWCFSVFWSPSGGCYHEHPQTYCTWQD